MVALQKRSGSRPVESGTKNCVEVSGAPELRNPQFDGESLRCGLHSGQACAPTTPDRVSLQVDSNNRQHAGRASRPHALASPVPRVDGPLDGLDGWHGDALIQRAGRRGVVLCPLCPEAPRRRDDVVRPDPRHAGVSRLGVSLSGRVDARAARHCRHRGILAEARLARQPEADVDVVRITRRARLRRAPQDDAGDAPRRRAETGRQGSRHTT